MQVPLLDLKAQYATIKDEIRAAILDKLPEYLCIKEGKDMSCFSEVKREAEKYIQKVAQIEFICGLREGWIDMGRQMLMDSLDERFGKVPDSVSNEINKIGNKYSLRTLLRHVFRSKSIEEFQQLLKSKDF